MKDLGTDVARMLPWFQQERDSPYILVRISEDDAATWVEEISVAIRRCYAADDVLDDRVVTTALPKTDVLAALLPDRGSVMAGDFGEILVFLYQGTAEHPSAVIGPKKWRLKQDRRKPAPYSDVVQFLVPAWPHPSADDCVLCSEVKTKSTPGNSTPIASAIADSEKDRVGRLANTLVWLRERAIHEDLGTTSLAHLDRFIEATDHPPAKKRFRAVAVLCASLLDDELAAAPDTDGTDYSLVVVAVPGLKQLYEDVFDAVHDSVDGE